MVVEKQQILYGSDVAAPTILRDLRSKSATDGTPSSKRGCDGIIPHQTTKVGF